MALTGLLPLGQGAARADDPPHYSHVIIVIEENRDFNDVFGANSNTCPYLKALADRGAYMDQYYAISHPSLPNYLALFSGSTQGLHKDSCDYSFSGPTLGSEMLDKGYSFIGYADDLPKAGYTDCSWDYPDGYAKKHCPWAYWQATGSLPASASAPFTSFPKPGHYNSLPTLCFVIPDLYHDMHNGPQHEAEVRGDNWLEHNLAACVEWVMDPKNNSLLIVTWDESDTWPSNRIPTLLLGAHLKRGHCEQAVTHYSLLRTLEDMYDLTPLGESATATPITEAFQ